MNDSVNCNGNGIANGSVENVDSDKASKSKWDDSNSDNVKSSDCKEATQDAADVVSSAPTLSDENNELKTDKTEGMMLIYIRIMSCLK